jgi:hypothetical protein
VQERLAFWWRALTRGAGQLNTAAGWLGLVVLILGVAAGIAVPLVFHVSPWFTAVILLALLVIVVLEGSYGVWKATDSDRESAVTDRDAARTDTERRFAALRYALRRENIDYRMNLEPDGTWSIEVGLRLQNTSDAYLRYEVEQMAVVIQGRAVENPTFYNRGTIIEPHGTDTFRYPFVTGVPDGWQTGSVEFTVRYGHPSAPLRYRKSQTLRLTTSRLIGVPRPHDIRIQADLVSDPDVEDI